MLLRKLLLLPFFLFGLMVPGYAQLTWLDITQPEFIEKTVVGYNFTGRQKFYNNSALYNEGWDTLAQCRFWQEIICLSHDSVIINAAHNRKTLHKIPAESWHCQTELEKTHYKKQICSSNGLCDTVDIYVTGGKKFFFEYRKVLPMISPSMDVFKMYHTDPWFAQAILLIESPGKTEAKSYVGARGPFQLMPYVARKYGLTVNKYRDDRTSLDKSAMAAARLISSVCVPYAKKILDEKCIPYHEKETWFRLFVLHIYHAGAGNVAGLINKINPTQGGMNLIRTMWQTEHRGFKNESQNYSQIALASMIQFDKLIRQEKDSVFLIQGDKHFKKYQEKKIRLTDTLGFLNQCLSAYESDLVDGAIPFEYYASQSAIIRAEVNRYMLRNMGSVAALSFPTATERLNQLGNELLYKRKIDEAIKVFHLGIEINPVASSTYDSLGKAYRMIGKNELAIKYTKKSKEVLMNPDAFIK